MSRANGLFFPVVFDNGRVVYPGLMDSLDASLRHIFSWPYGTRYFNPAFGSRIEAMLGRGVTPELMTSIKMDIRTAIEAWETRLIISSLIIESIEDRVSVKLEARIKYSQVTYNFETLL